MSCLLSKSKLVGLFTFPTHCECIGLAFGWHSTSRGSVDTPTGVHDCIWVMLCNIPLHSLPHASVELLVAVLQARDTALLVQGLTIAACKLRFRALNCFSRVVMTPACFTRSWASRLGRPSDVMIASSPSISSS